VGDTVNFGALAYDPDDGWLPPSAFSWRLTIEHCPNSCHEHPSGSWDGIASGSFVTEGHEFPSYLILAVTVTDAGGLQTTQTVSIYPNVNTVTINSTPPGLGIDARGVGTTPFTRTIVRGDRMSVSAPDQNVWIFPYEFDSWSDGGAQAHDIVVNNDMTLTAAYSVRQLSVPDRVVTEPAANTTVNIPVLLDRPSPRNTISAHYTVQTGTAGTNDIATSSGTVTIPAGSDRGQIPVQIKADTAAEPTETFRVTIDAPVKAFLARATGTVQIVDNDTPQPFFAYTSRFQNQWAGPMAVAAAKLGVPVSDLPRMGAVLLRFIAVVQPNNLPQLTAAPPGDYEYSTTYTSQTDRDGIVADAAKYGLNGTQLHTIGAQLLTYLVLLNG
jgi:hypothetical protein